jgi:pimeloyl-ACP methyl ester carboxylesterase
MRPLPWIVVALGVAVLAVSLAWNAGRRAVPLAELEAKYATADSRFAQVDGVRLHYMDQGEGEPVVLLHASFMNLRAWDPLAAALATRFRVVRPDFLISGLTGPDPTGDYSVERNLELVDGLAQSLGLGRFAIVATSSGGIVGFNYAARHPERVTRLVLINSAGMPRTAATDPNRARGGALERWLDAHWLTEARVRATLRRNFVPPHEPPDWLVAMNRDLWRREGRAAESALQLKAFRTGDPQAVLAGVRAPTYILWGLENATVMHLEADVFQHWLVEAPTILQKYPGVGHYLYLEVPEDTARDVGAFLAGERDAELVTLRRVPFRQ